MAVGRDAVEGEGRPVGLPCAVNCLATEIDFAITSRNEMGARAESAGSL